MPLSNVEIVTIAVYLLGGDSKYVDTEDIAIKTNELAPGRFTWTKYPEQINIDNIRKRLSDAKNIKKNGYILGSFKQGWILSEKGLKFSKSNINQLEVDDLSRQSLSRKEMAWKRREKERMLKCEAFVKFSKNQSDKITKQEIESFFRVNDYVTGNARERKLTLYSNMFYDDNEIGPITKILLKKIKNLS